jgi:hypothetical protein
MKKLLTLLLLSPLAFSEEPLDCTDPVTQFVKPEICKKVNESLGEKENKPKTYSEWDDEINANLDKLKDLKHIQCVYEQSRNITDDVGTNDTISQGVFTKYFAFNTEIFFLSEDSKLIIMAVFNPKTSKWIPAPGRATKFTMSNSKIEYSFTPSGSQIENSLELTEASGIYSINRLNGIMKSDKRFKFEPTEKTKGMNRGNYVIVKYIRTGNCELYEPSKSKF